MLVVLGLFVAAVFSGAAYAPPKKWPTPDLSRTNASMLGNSGHVGLDPGSDFGSFCCLVPWKQNDSEADSFPGHQVMTYNSLVGVYNSK